MNSFSHILVGQFLHRYLKEHHGIELTLSSFIYGNLLPDFKPFYKSLPHEPDSWEPFIKKEIKELTEHKQPIKLFGPNYSRRLGVICHFYADFFCFPHTEAYQGGTPQHMKYEWDLYRFSTRKTGVFIAGEGWETTEDRDDAYIYSLFRALHRSYLIKNPSFESDMADTLRACAMTLSMITANSLVCPELSLRKLITGGAES